MKKNNYELIDQKLLKTMGIVPMEEQEKGIYRSRYEYGEEELLKIIRYRRRGLIDNKLYRIYIKILEKNNLLF